MAEVEQQRLKLAEREDARRAQEGLEGDAAVALMLREAPPVGGGLRWMPQRRLWDEGEWSLRQEDATRIPQLTPAPPLSSEGVHQSRAQVALTRMAGPVRRAGQAAFEVRVGLRPAAGAGATLFGPAGMDLEPRTRLPTPWERWDAGTEAAEGDEAGRRWLVASNGRQCLLNDGRDRVVVTT